MDKERRRQLKALGKAEVARQSAAVWNALREANPAKPGDPEWSKNYRRGVEREKWLRKNLPLLGPKQLHEFGVKHYWRTTVGRENYAITLQGNLVRLTKHSGTPESFGGNDVPISRFLRSKKLQQHVKEIFGEAALNEVLSAVSANIGSSNA